MAHRSQCSSAGDNPLDPNYLPPHYREEYRLAIDALIEEDLEGYYQFLQKADVVDFLSSPEIQYIQECVQPPEQSNHPERFLEDGGDGSSDTYWPIHSDLDAPGLDLGWPQLHHFIGPTEVTTLVNPPEPEMPSIKEQARRLIKNAQQVIAIVMDMFTDVDIFHDVLTAAMRNVAVYILLDENNVHHFVNMVSNCRVDLQSIQFLRVRTVSGITYHCRSGKSFKGQMMDRFLLTDCRAVLSGNYSFMWSFEKLNRCMAHLFLGQLVSTFDEEFRILYAQSQPLVVEDMFAPMEDYSLLQKSQFPGEMTSLYRERGKFLPPDAAHPEEWPRHSYDERFDVDWRMMPLKKKEPLPGPADMYGRFPPHPSRMDPSFDQGPSRMPVMDNPYLKRHSYAEGVHGRYPFLQQQGMPEPENQGRPFHRWQQPHPVPGKEADYGPYDKFWNKDYLMTDQYPERGLPPEIEPPGNFDPVVNYLSSTGNVDFEQGSDKLLPAVDLPYSSSFPRRLSLGHSYACQTSPTPSNPTEQKQFFLEPSTDRKDPMVKRGLRDWRISSYLSAYDHKGDEGLPLAPPNMPDPFEEPSNVIQQTTTPGQELPVSKIPNVREFKVPAIPRASQMPSYLKITPREQPKNLPDEPTAVTAEIKITPATSESSSTTEGDKTEEAEQKEPKPSVFQREDSFRRKYNAGLLRSSRLRSSLIFGSLDQQHTPQDAKTVPGQQDEESEKNESEQTKPPFVSHGLAQRRPTAREPFEWSRYRKSLTFDNSATDTSKPDDGNSKAEVECPSKDADSKNLSGKGEVEKMLKPPHVEQTNPSPSAPQPKPPEAEPTKAAPPMEPPKSLLTTPMYVDMNDADMRLMFFKELAAKRKAAMAAQAEKGKEKAQAKPPAEKTNATVKKEEPSPRQTVESMSDTRTSEGSSEKNSTAEEEKKTSSTEARKSVSLSLEAGDETVSQDGQVENDPNTNQSRKEEQTRISTDPEVIKLKKDQPAANLPVSAEPETLQSESREQARLSSPAVGDSPPSHPPTTENATQEDAPHAQGTAGDGNPISDSTPKESSLLVSSSDEVPPSAVSDPNTQSPESANIETSTSHPPPSSEQLPESDVSSTGQSVKSPPSVESSLLVPSSGAVPPSAALDPNTQSPESANIETSTSHPPSSSEQHPESEIGSSNQSVKSPSSKESSLLSSDKVPPSAVSGSNIQSPESVDLVTRTSHPPSSSEQHPESEVSSSNQAVKSSSSKESSLLVPSSDEVPPSAASGSKIQTPESVNLVTRTSHPPKLSEQHPEPEVSSSGQSIKSPSSKESSLLVPSSGAVPPSAASSSNTQSPESVDLVISHPPPSTVEHSEPEVSSSGQSVKSSSSVESSLLVPSSGEVPQSAASSSNTQSPESVDLVTRTSHPPSSSEQHPESEIGSSNQAVKSPSSNESSLLSSDKVPPSAVSDPNTQSPESVNLITSTSQPPPSSEQLPESEISTSNQSVESASSLLSVPDSGSQISPSPSCSVPIPSEAETPSSEVILEDSSSTLTPIILSPNEPDTVSPARSVQEALEQPTAPVSQTESERTQPHSVSPSQLMSSETPSAGGPAHEEPQVSQDTFDVASEPITDSLQSTANTDSEESSAHSEQYVPESENNNSAPQASGEESEVLGSSENVKADSAPPNPQRRSPESCLPDVADLESKPRSDRHEVVVPASSAADDPSETSPAETNSPVLPESTTHASQAETITSQESPRHETFEPQPTGPVTPSSVEIASCSVTESVGSVLSHEAEPTLSASHPLSDADSPLEQVTTDSNKTPTDTCCPTEPTSKVPTEPESVTPETRPSEPPPEPAENGNTNTQNEVSQEAEMPDADEKKTADTEATEKVDETPFKESASSETTDDQVRRDGCPETPEIPSDEVIPTAPQAKQPKSSQARYHASTANVLSSSNLRDDTKLLLEQISANSQSRNDAAKESPVTDDEKEGEADKNARRERERGMRYRKSSQERELLLERIQSMRKERKVYSRFEMAP